MKKFLIIVLAFFCLGTGVSSANDQGFTQEDRERLIRLETTLRLFMEQTNKRFEELRADMNARFEELRADMNARFEQVYTFLWIITGIFTTLTVAVIGFAYWDRRTIIKRAKEETLEEAERLYSVSKLKDLLRALRELAREDEKLARVLKSFGLL